MSGRAFERFDWYEQAELYDIVFDADTSREADFLEAVSRTYGRGGRTVLEPGCGTGRLVAELARRGHRVTGVDCSAGSLRFARDRLDAEALRATLRRGRMEALPATRPVDLAHCLVSTFKYLDDEADATAALRGVADALRPRGVFVLGLHLSEYDDDRRRRERWVARRGPVEVVCNIQSWPADRRARTERLRSRLVVRRAGRAVEERYETSWTFRTYDAAQLRSLLRREPRLELVATHDFGYDLERTGSIEGDQLDLVLVLRRRP